MSEFTAGIQRRIAESGETLRRALAAGDDFGADLAQADLDDLRRIAADHGVEVMAESA